jgi:uncharacterized protein (DUF1684 family)
MRQFDNVTMVIGKSSLRPLREPLRPLRELFLLSLLLWAANTSAQSYTDSIQKHRQHYKEEFITEQRSPLKGNDTAYLLFYKPSKKYRVTATVQLTPETKAFEMPTRSGKTKPFRQYAVLSFKLRGKELKLLAYQNLNLLKDEKQKDHLFIPFTDATSYTETYGGGRYIDLSTADIKDNKLVIDFNKCYNPYCVFKDGYNCPVPPVENRLPAKIRAGEKLPMPQIMAHHD